MKIHSVFKFQTEHYGRAFITAAMLPPSGRYLVSIDEAESEGRFYRLRLSLQFPLTTEDLQAGLPSRLYTDAAGVQHRVNAGGYRATVYVAAEPTPGAVVLASNGLDVLRAALLDGWSGNIGVPGRDRLYLLPTHSTSGLVFDLEERTNPRTGETVPGLTNLALVDLTVGGLSAAVPVLDDTEAARRLLQHAHQTQPQQPQRQQPTQLHLALS